MTQHAYPPAGRRLPPARRALDEHPAVVNGTLALWAGLVGGLIVALGGFDEPRFAHNAWVRLMTLGATAAALAWALQTPRVALARRLQLGVAVSLVLHTLAAVGLSQAHLRLVAEPLADEVLQEATAEEKVAPPELVVVDRRPPDARPDFERPVASSAPQLKTDLASLERSAPRVEESPADDVAPEATPAELATLVPEPLAPTPEADAPSETSKTSAELAAAVAAEVAPVEMPAPLDDPAPTPPEPRMAAIEATDLPAVDLPSLLAAPAPEIASPSAVPLPPRRSFDSPEMAIATDRRQSEGPRLEGTSPLPLSEVAPPTPAAVTPTPSAIADSTALPRTTPATEAAEAPSPTDVAIDRPLPRLPASRYRQTPDLLEAPLVTTPTDRRADLARLRPDALSAITALVATPQATDPLPPRPAPLALARSRGGFAGLADSQNAMLDQLAAPSYLMQTPGAASRAEATTREAGEAEAPSDRPERPRSRAGAESPKSTLPPNTASAADIAATTTPGEANANSGASSESRMADAPLAESTAGAGREQVDRGASRVVAEQGAGRGAAGGQPELSLTPGRSRGGPAQPPVGTMAALPLALDAAPGPAGGAPGSSAAATPLNPSPIAPSALPAPAGGGPRQPRRSRGPAPATLAIAPAPATDEAPPLRVAMRGAGALSAGATPRLVDPAGIGSTTNSTPGAGGLAMASSKSLTLPDSLRPRSTSIAGEERKPAAAFDNRGRRLEEKLSGGAGQPASKTEAAVEMGLKFLAKLQRADGRWSFASLGGLEVPEEELPNVRADAAATGLALLSMLGAGYDHFGGPYQRQVDRGLAYLTSIQKPSGELFPEETGDGAAWQVARYYSHGIATIALCEAYGMTGDAQLREPAQRAIDYITRTQTESLGGWRYTPGVNADLSVTGWQMMAMKSGELAGLSVDPAAYVGVRRFVELCRERAGDQSRFCYNPTAPASDPRTNHGRRPGTVMTSVGLLMQLYLGEDPTGERSRRGADHLLENLPTLGDGPAPARTSTLGNPLRDTYYWYYATQVMYHTGGQHWTAWSDALRPVLLEGQTLTGPLAGSWNPRSPTPDKWSAFGGRLYVTAMNLLSLEVSYRHLPLYGGVRGERSEIKSQK